MTHRSQGNLSRQNRKLRFLVEHPLILILLVATLIRVSYLAEYINLPFLFGPVADSQVYLAQANAVRELDFGHSALIAQSPLYGYFLASARMGRGYLSVVLIQMALGLLLLVLVFKVAGFLFGRRAALFSAVLYSAYGFIPFLETKLLAETLGLAVFGLAFFAIVRFDLRSLKPWQLLGIGLLLGLSMLTRTSAAGAVGCLLLALPFCRSIATAQTERPGAKLITAAVVVSGLLGILLFNGLWNYSHSGRFVPLILPSPTGISLATQTWNGSLTAGDDPKAISAMASVHQANAGSSPIDDERSEPPGLSSIAHSWLINLPAKLSRVFWNREIIFQYGYLGERSEIITLGLLPGSFWLLLLWGGYGSVIFVRRFGLRPLLPYLAVIVGCILVGTVYHPTSRYRLPMILPLLLLGGLGIDSFLRLRWKDVHKERLLAICLTSATIATCVHTYGQRLIHPHFWEMHKAQSASVYGDVKGVERYLQAARLLMTSDEEFNESLVLHGWKAAPGPH